MDKRNRIKKASAYKTDAKISKAEEPLALYAPVSRMPLIKDFKYRDFKKVADKVPITQQEWAEILHISERTLQRYAKTNSSFPFSVTDRFLQVHKVIKRGIEVFGNVDKFMLWLKDKPSMLEGRLSLHSLANFDGINMVLTQLGRIEHGILA